MAEQEREKARNELALSNQRLNVAEEERARAEQKLLEDHRGAGQVGDWLLDELHLVASRRELRAATETKKKAAAEVATAEEAAAAAHQKHRVFERFHDNIADRIAQGARRKEALDADAFALVMWSKKRSDVDDDE
jgi:hypothetical protein